MPVVVTHHDSTGLTLTTKVIAVGGSTYTAQALAESPAGRYTASFTGLAAGRYTLLTEGGGTLRGVGAFEVDSAGNEVTLASVSGVAGAGDVLVDHSTGGTDNLRFATAGGQGVGNVEILVYLKAEYDASASTATVRGRSITRDDGRWLRPVPLQASIAHTIVFNAAPAGYASATKEVTP